MNDRSKEEEEHQRLIHELNERVKELTALHSVARLLQDDQRPAAVLLQEIVNLLPAALEHAQIASARIVFGGAEYRAANFLGPGRGEAVTFTTATGKEARLEITYPERGSKLPESFLPEEKTLLDSIAELLRLYLDRQDAREKADQVTKELVDRNKEIWALQREMGRVEQLAALGWMAGAIAHELGTPLNSVLGYTQLLAREELPEKARRYVTTIAGQVERMTNVVQYYLDRTRGSTSKRAAINLNELVRETLSLLRPVLAEKGVRALTDLDGAVPMLNAHGGSLQQVLINLINNAVASLQPNGTITIQTRCAHPEEIGRAGVILTITDTGTGIPAHLLPRVFDLFMTTRAPGDGTGLGLAVSQEIVKAHGGKISIASEVGKGTTVQIFLPIGPAAASAPKREV
jgi:signal transduction histidine kinase